jgi:hypothetical protein
LPAKFATSHMIGASENGSSRKRTDKAVVRSDGSLIRRGATWPITVRSYRIPALDPSRELTVVCSAEFDCWEVLEDKRIPPFPLMPARRPQNAYPNQRIQSQSIPMWITSQPSPLDSIVVLASIGP